MMGKQVNKKYGKQFNYDLLMWHKWKFDPVKIENNLIFLTAPLSVVKKRQTLSDVAVTMIS